MQLTRQLVGTPDLEQVLGRDPFKAAASFAGVLGFEAVVGVAGHQLQAFGDFTADFCIEAFAHHLAGVEVAAGRFATDRAGTVLIVNRGVVLFDPVDGERSVDPTIE
ncbi:hypothetical protein D3C77_247430 [compost metagenome]